VEYMHAYTHMQQHNTRTQIHISPHTKHQRGITRTTAHTQSGHHTANATLHPGWWGCIPICGVAGTNRYQCTIAHTKGRTCTNPLAHPSIHKKHTVIHTHMPAHTQSCTGSPIQSGTGIGGEQAGWHT